MRELGLSNGDEWLKYSKGEFLGKKPRPNDIPSTPWTVYKGKGWKGKGDWLGTGYIAPRYRKHLPFRQARALVHSLGLSNHKQWRMYCKGELPGKMRKPDDIPSFPAPVYQDQGWKSWGDWLGTDTVATFNRKYRSFAQACAFVRSLKLSRRRDWSKYCKGELPGKKAKPEDIPSAPEKVYQDKGWKGLGDWLGTGNIANRNRKHRHFQQARAFVQKLGLSSTDEWTKYCKGELPGKRRKPEDIPNAPQNVYRDKGWKSMGDWLGTGVVATYNRKYRTFRQAREFVQRLGLKGQIEWRKYCKGELPERNQKPDDIPSNPNTTYQDQGWKGFGDWIGTGNVATFNRKYRPFVEARAFVHKLKLSRRSEWKQYCKGELPGKKPKPDDIPSNPERVYRGKGWKGLSDWLCKDSDSTSRSHS